MATTSSHVFFQHGNRVLSHIGSALGLVGSEEDKLHWREMQMKRIQMGQAGLQSFSGQTKSDQVLESLENKLESYSKQISTKGSNRSTHQIPAHSFSSSSGNLARRRSKSLSDLMDSHQTLQNTSNNKCVFISPQSSNEPVNTWDGFIHNQRQLGPYLERTEESNPSFLEIQHYKEEKKELLKRQKYLNDIIHVARGKELLQNQEHYFGRYGIEEEKWRKLVMPTSLEESGLKSSVKLPPFIRTQLEEQVFYRPWATSIQVLALLVMCGLHGLAKIDLDPSVDVLSEVTTFLGTETVARWTQPNMWIGPSPAKFIESGALYAPCLREDITILSEMARQENNSPNPRLGCCIVTARKMAGTTTEMDCDEFTNGVGDWLADTPCSWRPPSSHNQSHTARPCCVGLQGMCLQVSETHCDFLQGVYHRSGPEHCSQVNCLASACGETAESNEHLTESMSNTSGAAHVPRSSPAQHWRIVKAMFLPPGWLALLHQSVLLFVLGRRVEASAGWPRMVLIYLTCSIGGLLTGALFTPLMPHMGGQAAVSGLLGVLTLDTFQNTSLLSFPWRDLLKISVILSLELLTGTLPYVDNYEFLGGFLFGVLSALVLLPYISLGRWHVYKRRLLILVATPTLLFLFAMFLYLVYTVQTIHTLCPACLLFNCAPYTDHVCDLMKIESQWSQSM